MRTLLRFILLTLIAITLYWLAPALHLSNPFQQGRDTYKLDLVKRSTPAITYEVPAQRWLDFKLESGTSQIRIISSATVPEIAPIKQAQQLNPMKRWQYAILIEVFDKNGHTLLRQEHHMRTSLSLYKDVKDREYTPAFYLQDNRVPLAGKIVRLNFTGLASPDRMRLRLISKDAEITDVVARVYLPKKMNPRKVSYLWQRLSEKAKSSLAVGNVYPTELLTEEEKHALLLNTWQPIGPDEHQRNYKKWDYYVLHENEGEVINDPVPPVGMAVSAHLNGIIALPEDGGAFRLQFKPMQSPIPGTVASQGEIQLKWYGDNAFKRQTIKLHWNGQSLDHTLHLGGGMLEISSESDLVVRAFQINRNADDVEITPQPQYLRTYATTPAHIAEYNIAHVQNTATPIKIDLRYINSTQDTSNTRSIAVKYSLHDKFDKLIKQGIITLDKPDTKYDLLMNSYSGARLSDPGTYYFLLPGNVTKLRLNSIDENTPVLVSVYSRPLNLPHSYRAPEDQFDFDAQGKRINAWFGLKPDNNVQLLSNNASVLMTVQSRPPEDKPELLTGNYFWEDFHPLGNWLGRIILVPQEAGTPFRMESLPTIYQIIPQNRTLTINVPAYENLQTLTPNLIWVRPQETPVEFRLFIDDHLHQSGKLAGRSGEINLLPMNIGMHQIRLETDAGGNVFLNHIRPTSQAYVKKLANQLEKELHFQIQRDTLNEETISASLFQPDNSKARSQLKINVRAPIPPSLIPLNAWVFPVRQFDVRPKNHAATIVFSTQGHLTDVGQSFFIQLPEGAPKGLYHFDVKLQSGSGGYLLLSRLTPGIKATRRVLHETDVMTYESTQN